MSNDEPPFRIGISSCLIGERVRFDTQHKRQSYLVDTVGQFVEWVSVCPEMAIGLGTPRPTMRLERDEEDGVRLVVPKTGADLTSKMTRWARKRARELEKQELCGYVLKKDSPSCGMERVRLYDHNGVPGRIGVGLFAQALMDHSPLLPVEEEGRLKDPRLRENFFTRVFAYRRIKEVFRPRWTLGQLVAAHTKEKLLLMAHDQAAYRELGRLVAHAKGKPRKELAETYQQVFMTGLKKQATVRKNTNVLQHCQGYFKKLISKEDRAELTEVIANYKAGLIPLVVPVTLIRHHARSRGVEYLQGQSYLEPHPRELMLRNHV